MQVVKRTGAMGLLLTTIIPVQPKKVKTARASAGLYERA